LPKYTKDIKPIVEFDDAEAMIQRARHEEHKVLVAVEYHTGARPVELLELKKGDFTISGPDLRVVLATKKSGDPRLISVYIHFLV
jgi:integrase